MLYHSTTRWTSRRGILLWGIPHWLNFDWETDPLGVHDDDAYNLMLQEQDTCTPYGCFLTRVFKDADVDLSKEIDFEAPNIYNTYDDQSMGRMKFEKALDVS